MSGFWDRRLAAVAAEAEADAQSAVAAAQAEEQAQLEARDDAELLEELGLPSPDNLVDGAHLREFLKAQLPQRLKTRALRGFWRSNPVLACLDGLNDYDDDYTLAQFVFWVSAVDYDTGTFVHWRSWYERIVFLG